MTNTVSLSNTGNTVTVNRTGYTIAIYDGAIPVAATTYATPAYANQYGSGNRVAAFLNRMLVGNFGGAILPQYAVSGYFFDGDTTTNCGYSTNGAAVADDIILLDFTGLAADTFKITEMKFYFSGTMNCGTWKPQELIDGVWTDIGASFVLGASNPTVIDCSSSTGSYMFRLLGVSGTASWDASWREIEFKIGAQTS
jgi:hypothetical protein